MPETLSLQARQQLEEAVGPSLDRIRQDREGAPLHIQRLLVHIENYLLDPDLDVTQAKRACGIGDKFPRHHADADRAKRTSAVAFLSGGARCLGSGRG